MKNEKKKTPLGENITEKIKSGEIKMRSRTYFFFRLVLAVFAAFLAVFFLLYLASLIVFSLKIKGVWFLPAFGLQGIGIFLASLPWILILTVISLAFLLELLIKNASFIYRRPAVYSLLLIFVLVLAGGVAIGKTSFHADMLEKSEKTFLPLAGKIYKDLRMQELENVQAGIVSEITEKGFLIEELNKETEEIEEILVNTTTNFLSAQKVEKGDTVIIMGEKKNGEMRASGVRKIEKKDRGNFFCKIKMCRTESEVKENSD